MLTAANLPNLLNALVAYSALCIALNVTVWAVAAKYAWEERYDAYKPAWMPERCAICIPFWFTMGYTLPIAAWSGAWVLLAAPFLAAGLTLKKAIK